MFGNAPGGSAPRGEGVWGALNIRLTGGDASGRREATVAADAYSGPAGTAKQQRWGGAVRTPQDLASRVEVVKRRDAYERDGAAFSEAWSKSEARVRRQIVAGRARIGSVVVPDAALERAAQLCMALGTDGLRGELTLIRAARAFAALQGDSEVGDVHLKRVAPPALRHRLRRNPLDDAGSSVRVDRAVTELFGA